MAFGELVATTSPDNTRGTICESGKGRLSSRGGTWSALRQEEAVAGRFPQGSEVLRWDLALTGQFGGRDVPNRGSSTCRGEARAVGQREVPVLLGVPRGRERCVLGISPTPGGARGPQSENRCGLRTPRPLGDRPTHPGIVGVAALLGEGL